MVTLIGFFFILGNVGLLVLFVPDLIGPVRFALLTPTLLRAMQNNSERGQEPQLTEYCSCLSAHNRDRHGYT